MPTDLVDLLEHRAMRDGGRLPVLAARLDPRCSYCLYCPTPLHRDAEFNNLLVYVHGEGRQFQFLLNALRPLARTSDYVVVCPLFPGNILRDGNIEGYKYLQEDTIRYDLLLIDIVNEVKQAFAFREQRFLLGGFSGGGQFAHRFAYLHPGLLKAVSVAAPGSVTLLEDQVPWWPGIGGVADHFGLEVDLAELRALDIQLVIGDADAMDVEARPGAAKRYWMRDANLAGTNRVARVRSLHRSFEAHGIRAKLDLVPSVAHRFPGLLPSIETFFGPPLPRAAEPASSEDAPPHSDADGVIDLAHPKMEHNE